MQITHLRGRFERTCWPLKHNHGQASQQAGGQARILGSARLLRPPTADSRQRNPGSNGRL